MTSRSLHIKLDDISQVADARRRAGDMAADLGFNKSRTGVVALLVSEAASNVIKHAGRGELLIRTCAVPGKVELEVIAIDRGPGFDVQRASRDGYSTAGTLGGGLGAMHRMACEADLYSVPGQGTVVRLLVRETPLSTVVKAPRTGAFDYGAVGVPYPGELLCGDQWKGVADGRHGSFLLADGLGHGPEACEASRAACAELTQPDEDPSQVLTRADLALKHTRGAAVSVATLHLDDRRIAYAGIGNVSGCLLSPSTGGTRQMVSYNGIVGHNVRKCQTFDYPFEPGTVLMMYSDGLTSHLKVEQYPAWFEQHPAIMAAVLYRDHARGRDDAMVLVARERLGVPSR